MGVINKKEILNSEFIEKTGLKIYYKVDPEEIEIVDMDQKGKIVKEIHKIKVLGISDKIESFVFFSRPVKDLETLKKEPLEKALGLEKTEIDGVNIYFRNVSNSIMDIITYFKEEKKGVLRVSQTVAESIEELRERAALKKKERNILRNMKSLKRSNTWLMIFFY
jgi:hypothetical protein